MGKIEFENNLNDKSDNIKKVERIQTQSINTSSLAMNYFNNVEHISQENASKNDQILQNDRQQIIDILQKQINRRTEDDIKILVEYFKKFDFSKREKINQEKRDKEAKDKLYKDISLKNKFQRQQESNKSSSVTTPLDKKNLKKKSSVILDQNQIACDDQSLEQSCRLMKFLMVPKYETIFEYDSFGDLFFMVLQGEAHCKIPVQTNLILLNDSEKTVYQLQFKADLIKMNVYDYANQLQQKIQDIQKKRSLIENVTDYFGKMDLQKIDNALLEFQKKQYLLSKEMPMTENPYLYESRQQLQEYVEQILLNYKIDILRKQNNRDLQKNAKSQIMTQSLSQNSQNETSIQSTSVLNMNDHITVSNQENEQSKRKLIKQGSILDESTNNDFYNQNPDFQKFYNACKQLLDRFEDNEKRQFYEVKLLRTVQVYKEFQSFGELALIQNKPRAAKLVVEGPNNAFFAVLSKKDYKLAQGKLQNEILQKKIKFLRKFIIFKNLSDSALSSLSYIMEEKICSRDQIILREDIDSSDYIYLVKKGEFKSFKKVTVESEQKQNEPVFLQKKDNLNNNQSSIDIENLKKQDALSKYKTTIETTYLKIDICIHEQFDMFGYQEFFSESSKTTISYSVQCLQQNSILFAIHKSYLSNYIRRNPEIYQILVQKWNKLIEQRQNQTLLGQQKDIQKIFMDQNDIELLKKNQQNANRKIIQEIENLKEKSQEKSPVKNQSLERQLNYSQISSPNQKLFTIENQYQSIDQQKSIIISQNQNIGEKLRNYQTNYKDFRKSQQGSISQQELKNIKQIESRIQKIIQKNFKLQNMQNYSVSGSVEKQQTVLESQNLPKNIRMKQHLFNPLIKKNLHAEKSKFKLNNYKNLAQSDLENTQNFQSSIIIPTVQNNYDLSQENSVFSQGNILKNFIDLKNQNKYFQDKKILKNEFSAIQNSNINEEKLFEKKESKQDFSESQYNLKQSQKEKQMQSTIDSFPQNQENQEYDFTEWNKELEVIQQKCNKFINMNRAQTTNMSSNIFKERQKDVLDEIFKIQLNDQVVVEQNKNFIYASQRDYNFDKDINNLIKQKESKLLGLKMHDGDTTFQSSEQNLQLKHNQSDLSYAKIKLQREKEKDSIRQNLVNNPILSDVKQQKNLRYLKGNSKNKTLSKLEDNNESSVKRKILKIYSKSNFGTKNVFTANIQSSLQDDNERKKINYGQLSQMQIRQNILNFSVRHDNNESQIKQSKWQSKQIMKNLPIDKDIKKSFTAMDDFKTVEKAKNKFSLPKIIMRQVLFDNSDSVIEYFQKKDQNVKINQKEQENEIKQDEQIIKKPAKKILEKSFQEKTKQTYKLKKIDKDSIHSNFQTVGIDIDQKLDEQIESSDLHRDSIINENHQTDRLSIDKLSKSSINSNLLKSMKSNITKNIKDVLATKYKNQKKMTNVFKKQQSIYSKDQIENDYRDAFQKNNSIYNSENSQVRGEILQSNSFRAQSKVKTDNDSQKDKNQNNSQKNENRKSNRSSIDSVLKQKSSDKSKKKKESSNKKSESSNKKSKIVIEKSLTVDGIKIIKENASETQSNISSKGKHLKVNSNAKKPLKRKKDKISSIDKKNQGLHEIQIDTVSEKNIQKQKIKKAVSSIDSDSILPEYRVNAKKLTKEELISVQKYHQENFKKFHVEISSDDEQILKQDTD